MKAIHAILFFIAGTALMVLFYSNELLLFGLMGISTLACLAMDKWKNARKFIIATLIGGVCENMAVMMGAWDYSNAGFLFAPLWLPVGWGLAVVLLDEMMPKIHSPSFKLSAPLFAFGGTIATGFVYISEFGTLLAFAAITGFFILTGFYHRSELKAGVLAALLGTGMEATCIIFGSWQYTVAALGTPL